MVDPLADGIPGLGVVAEVVCVVGVEALDVDEVLLHAGDARVEEAVPSRREGAVVRREAVVATSSVAVVALLQTSDAALVGDDEFPGLRDAPDLLEARHRRREPLVRQPVDRRKGHRLPRVAPQRIALDHRGHPVRRPPSHALKVLHLVAQLTGDDD
eukprot:CAMPEP_0118890218 /NCGR_PEP_ID=MMETSP1166-20130328/785_1 /TAXON_ID=1104430 /ORGANISM="Chrysoreinhardia sp, Strain CCMP3193" /LENGTH=156 /DNA_ID=CAMNT_0006828823 /DNA_START=128 /DNA_END=598 /DNA_ORIENTATION=+